MARPKKLQVEGKEEILDTTEGNVVSSTSPLSVEDEKNEPQQPEQEPEEETNQERGKVVGTSTMTYSNGKKKDIHYPPQEIVKATVRYSANYKGRKRYKDGDELQLSKETSEIFKRKGII